ncbi:MAG: DUF362 domain-containing protein [Eubacteriales bacterium]|nr:DUF362 domain-containing protein [Eubacteriales bacterium]
MDKAKVYFTDFSARKTNLTDKLKRLMKAAGFESIDFSNKFAAVKIHFGEPGNLAYLRPNYAKAVCDYIGKLGGKPFLTDCNTLYPGKRKNALEHLDSAYTNGYNPFCTGVHVIIGDGLKGTDDISVPVAGGEHVSEAKIGRAVMDADIFISLNHFKGHEATGFGGALKNIGMGCGSRGGKMEMHSSGKPVVKADECIGCRLCLKGCAHNAITFIKNKANINQDICVGCGRCIGTCNNDAIVPGSGERNDVLCKKIAEYSKAVLDGRPGFHISLVLDVSPYCDCYNLNDLPIVPDIGMFASFDPIAIDQACADAVNAETPIRGSLLDEAEKTHHDHFTDVSPNTDWKVCLEHGEKLGLGTREYELIKIK